MKNKILIIGAGWYGCHLSMFFQNKGIEVHLFEKRNEIFQGMSGFNSNRLHKGFHYPRSNHTRNACNKNFYSFKKKYPQLSKKIKNNLIGIHKNSLIDLDTYRQILNQSNIDYTNVKKIDFNFKNIEGFIKCDEEVIDPVKSKDYFNNSIKNIHLKHKINDENSILSMGIINNEKFNWVFDCSACTMKKKYNFNIAYEPRITLLYESKIKSFACMMMDGPFWSIYPQLGSIYTLGSVVHSRIAKKTTYKNSTKIINTLSKNQVTLIKRKFENQVVKDFINFKDLFKFVGFYCSLTTIYNSVSDSRPILINQKNKLIEVLGAKIDNVFEVEKILKRMFNF